jgi:hypothetical protein
MCCFHGGIIANEEEKLNGLVEDDWNCPQIMIDSTFQQ